MSASSISPSTQNLLCTPDAFLSNVNTRLIANTIVLVISFIALAAIGAGVLAATNYYFPNALLYVASGVATVGWYSNGIFFAKFYAQRGELSNLRSRELAVLNALDGDVSNISRIMKLRIKLAEKQNYTQYIENAMTNLAAADPNSSDSLYTRKVRAMETIASKLGMTDPANQTLLSLSEKLEKSSKGFFRAYYTVRHLFNYDRTPLARRLSIKHLGWWKNIDFSAYSPARICDMREKENECRFLNSIKNNPSVTTTLEEAGQYDWRYASATEKDSILLGNLPFCREYGHDISFQRALAEN